MELTSMVINNEAHVRVIKSVISLIIHNKHKNDYLVQYVFTFLVSCYFIQG